MRLRYQRLTYFEATTRRGAGVMLFAYGGYSTLRRFVAEAVAAATSLRVHNPRLQIALVTNNASVDARVISVHIAPRPDLLFAGENSGPQGRADRLRRQWLTRLYRQLN